MEPKTLIPKEKLRKLEKKDRRELERTPHDHEWPPPIANPQLLEHFWVDPDPSCGGVLTADRIRAYNYAVGRMIRPFQDSNLNPASYDLTLGPHCVVDGKEVILGRDRRVLEIPPSSITFVTSREELFIPPWLAATFNLKSTYIFDGLLMGVGPQIDPGYQGVLTCPLHNISNDTIRLTFLMPFAKLDFVKTTWGNCVDVDDIKGEDAFYRRGENGRLRSRDKEKVKILARPQEVRALPGHGSDPTGATSLLKQLEEEFREVRGKLRITEFAAVGFLAVLVSVAMLVITYANGRVDDVRSDNAQAVQAQNALLTDRLERVERSVEKAERQTAQPVN